MMTERSASKLACTPRSCRVDQRLVRETSESATRMVDARIEKWRRWCDERILPDVHTMYLRR